MIPVKICGLTRESDAALAWARGASALGFILYPASPRAVTARRVREIRRALPPEAFCIGVFVDEDPGRVNAIAEEAGPGRGPAPRARDARSLRGHRPARASRPSARRRWTTSKAYPVAAFLLDAFHPTSSREAPASRRTGLWPDASPGAIP